jgi:hypothetical protein
MMMHLLSLLASVLVLGMATLAREAADIAKPLPPVLMVPHTPASCVLWKFGMMITMGLETWQDT